MKLLYFNLLFFALSTLSSCSDKHPETIYGIKLGYPAEEEFIKASEAGNIEYSKSGGIWMNLSDGIRGKITRSTFKDEDGTELLESLQINFLYTYPPLLNDGLNNTSPSSYIPLNQKDIIKNLFFKKYGNIDETKPNIPYNDLKNKDYYNYVTFDDSTVNYIYDWYGNNRHIMLTIYDNKTGNYSIEANYYSAYIEDIKSKLEKKADRKKNNF